MNGLNEMFWYFAGALSMLFILLLLGIYLH